MTAPPQIQTLEPTASSASPFNSFLMGGFECSSHRDARGRRLDLIHSTRHDVFAEADYARLLELGMATARDGLRWHLIEREPGRYDFSSARLQVEAARRSGIQIIWDLFHYGFPDDLDIFSAEFVKRFAEYSREATRFLKDELGEPMVVCPVNEISFFSWIAGSVGQFYPCAKKRGTTLKRQLVKSACAAIHAIRKESPSARIVLTDPAIHVVPGDDSPAGRRAAENYRRAQFQAFDMIAGIIEPELGGHPDFLDIIGLNYYFHSQWRHTDRRKIPLGSPSYRPLNEILTEYSGRYKRSLILAETGIEDDERAKWFRYVSRQATLACSNGVPLHGLCLYPIVNHPGWADDRHCHNGLWDYPDDHGRRDIYKPLADEIEAMRPRFAR